VVKKITSGARISRWLVFVHKTLARDKGEVRERVSGALGVGEFSVELWKKVVNAKIKLLCTS